MPSWPESSDAAGSSTARADEVDCGSAPLATSACADRLPEPSYFESLDLLDSWADLRQDPGTEQRAARTLNAKRDDKGLVDIREVDNLLGRSEAIAEAGKDERPKVLVCHDFQGGYKEEPSTRGYTFDHWQLCDIFVYFSHQRVTVPLPGWIASAHRHGTQILGTLIFEWEESSADLALLLRGPKCEHVPLSGPGRIARGSSSNAQQILFSPHYADALITLALQRGFDGYLVNIEVALELGFQCSAEKWPWWVPGRTRKVEMQKNAMRLRAWVAYLRLEGRRRIREWNDAAEADAAKNGTRPPRRRAWHICWYDSVTATTGELAWQDALTAHNRDFFAVADSIFTNYTWARPPAPQPPGQFPAAQHGFTGPRDGGYHPALVHSARVAASIRRSPVDVFIGIDVFGRNCWGGMESWRSLQMIRPPGASGSSNSGLPPLSVALFAPGWTWEHEEPGTGTGRAFSHWLAEDQAFWRGTGPKVGARAVADYFPSRPVPLHLTRGAPGLWTSFGRASGERWHHRGRCVRDWRTDRQAKAPEKGAIGWTDAGVSMPQADAHLLRGLPGWQLAVDEEVAWSGNCSLRFEGPRAAEQNLAQIKLPLLRVQVRSDGPAASQTALLRIVTKLEQGAQVECYAAEQSKGSHLDAKSGADKRSTENGWRLDSVEVVLPAFSETLDLVLGVVFTPPASSPAGNKLWVGSIGLDLDSDTAASNSRRAQASVSPTGHASWSDFDASAPFYELFSASDQWLGTATRELSRTEAVLNSGEGEVRIVPAR